MQVFWFFMFWTWIHVLLQVHFFVIFFLCKSPLGIEIKQAKSLEFGGVQKSQEESP